jgi:hypothetical protein
VKIFQTDNFFSSWIVEAAMKESEKLAYSYEICSRGAPAMQWHERIKGLLQIEWVIFAILKAIPVFNDDGIAMDDCRIGVARRSDSSGAAIEATSNSEAESTCRPHLIPIVSSQAHACKVWAFRPPPPAASDLTDAGAREELVPP